MRRHNWFALIGLVAAAFPVNPGWAAEVESWADPRLTVRDGLILWLDAVGQSRAHADHGLPAPASGGPLGVWFDASGHDNRVLQRSLDARPRLLVAGGKAAVHFDGKDDCLEQTALDWKTDRATVFLYAAARANTGHFAGLLALNQVGHRDYQSGLTIDLGPRATERFEALNVEGKGFQGARDLLDVAFPLGTFHTIEVEVGTGAGGVALTVDGRPQGRRDRAAGAFQLDEPSVGARFYSNGPIPAFTQGFFDGAIAEVLVYDRTLAASEAQSVREYLSRKYAVLSESLAPQAAGAGQPEWRVSDPPPVQVLVPGFNVRELPVRLTNINNLKYRHDGKLVALAYSGNIYLLSDRDGDGLEEHVETFWENQGRLRAPIGLALLPTGYREGAGVVVPSQGKCSLIVDTDGDDRADREIVIAQGWPGTKHGVDGLGVALADDGSIYFGIGTASFTEAYQVDAAGKSHYDLKDERGTILRVAPDLKSRTIVATGIRYPVALAFNRGGDLFCTDQEGATWLPNGNPFDELLHVQAGRHYGFPARHSRHLPGVIDEPSVFDYKPQHQSTCGLNFNEPVLGGPVFGPRSWTGDALVSGYSRGKLFRTKLLKTAAGYVAQTALFAVLDKLTVDACVSPRGDLVVATHSGGPDWGSGPNGQGTLYRIAYNDRNQPQPVIAWAQSPREVRVAFDRPLDPGQLKDLTRGTSIQFGPSVSAGDRFETVRPGYAVVMAQLGDPHTRLAVHSVGLSPDRRTLILATEPQSMAVAYTITLPGLGRPARSSQGPADLPQEPAIDLAYGLNGVEAEWNSSSGDLTWTGWLPHLDLAVARDFTAGSADHDRLWPLLSQPGTLTLRTQVELRNLLRPAVQPGSSVDDRLPPEQATLALLLPSSPILSSMTSAKGSGSSNRISVGPEASEDSFTITPVLAIDRPVRLEIVLQTQADRTPRLDVSYHTNEDRRPRALPVARIFLPWASLGSATKSPELNLPPGLAGGNWATGRELFFGKEARCGECHVVGGRGGTIGPDLTNLPQRDFVSVLRDIREPSFAINPDHVTYNIALNNGRVLSGTLRAEGSTLRIGDSQGRETLLDRSEVEQVQPQSVSTMPEGLIQALGQANVKHLLAFLLAPELRPAPIEREGAPPARTRAEVDAVLGTPPPAKAPPGRALHVVLVSGPKDHGVDEHDYPAWQKRWEALLSRAEGVTVSTAQGWPSAEDFKQADVLVWYSANPAWTAEKGKDLDAFLERGGGMVLLHYAVNGQKAPKELAQRIGLAWQGGHSKFRHGPLDLTFNAPGHPITAGLRGLHLEDESYWQLAGDPGAIEVLATAVEEGSPRPLLWTRTVGKGRVFCSIPGHYTWTFDDPLFRIMILRGIAWAANEPADRLVDLATQGARLATEMP